MNEFYEAVANFLEEMRCDSGEREYAIIPEDMKESAADLKKKQKKFLQSLEKMSDGDRSVLEEYIDVIERAHFKEEQRSYYQGIMDGVELLSGLGLVKKRNNMKK